MRLVISDAGAGLKAAMADFLPGAARQRCTVHVMRNVLDKVPQTKRADVAAALKTIWHQENAQEARHKAARVVEQFTKSLPAAMRTLEAALEDSLTFYGFPREHWKMLRTNNPLERLMKEIRRRTKVAEQFPSEDSALLLVTARLKRLGRAAGSALRVYDLLRQRVVLSAPRVARELGLTWPTVNAAQRRLEQLGIV